jgi:protoheme ferro-lyase
MRYWHPFTESAVADIKADGMDQVVVSAAVSPFFDQHERIEFSGVAAIKAGR